MHTYTRVSFLFSACLLFLSFTISNGSCPICIFYGNHFYVRDLASPTWLQPYPLVVLIFQIFPVPRPSGFVATSLLSYSQTSLLQMLAPVHTACFPLRIIHIRLQEAHYNFSCLTKWKERKSSLILQTSPEATSLICFFFRVTILKKFFLTIPSSFSSLPGVLSNFNLLPTGTAPLEVNNDPYGDGFMTFFALLDLSLQLNLSCLITTLSFV